MKKILSIVMAIVMCLGCLGLMASCGSDTKKTDSNKVSDTKSDLEYVKNKGTLVVGITDFEPMDYQDKSGNWIGFDADMAAAFAKSLGVKVEFVEIDWDSKVMELENKSIDCVWNGMTLTDGVKASMDCSDAYCNNAQIIVLPKEKIGLYKTADACKGLKFAVEKGSAGEDMAKANKFEYTAVQQQSDALMEVASGTSDAAIIDSLMAAAMVGEGTSYANLAYSIELNSEEYGVGFRKGSDLVAKINEFFKTSKENGETEKIAEKYGVQAALAK